MITAWDGPDLVSLCEKRERKVVEKEGYGGESKSGRVIAEDIDKNWLA